MEALFRYYALALELGPQEFSQRFKSLFLLKRPSEDVEIPLETLDTEEELETRRMSDEVEPGVYREEGTMAAEWRVAPLVKAPRHGADGPIVIGRGRNCDVVLPFSSVSKHHAAVYPLPDDPRAFQLADIGSSNGTYLRGERLEKGKRVMVHRQDRILFGLLELEVVDAVMLYAVLQST